MSCELWQGGAPERNSKWFYSLYFVIFVCIGSFLILNLFISAVVDTFEKERDKATGMVLLTEPQEMFVLSMRQVIKTTAVTTGFDPPDGDSCWAKFRCNWHMAVTLLLMVGDRLRCYYVVSWGDHNSGNHFDHLVRAVSKCSKLC